VAILGIGVNVAQESFPGHEQFVYPPTSLRLATGQPQTTARVIAAIGVALTNREALWRHEGFSPILTACRQCLAVGSLVRRGAQQAELIGLGTDGSAEVRLPDGTFALWTTVD